MKFAKNVEEAGAGEIMITDKSREGSRKGYNLSLTKMISSNVKIPVIASQRDIAPTILDILKIDIPVSFSGSSLLAPNKYRIADFYHNGSLGWVSNHRLVEVDVMSGKLMSCCRYSERHLFESAPCDYQDKKNASKGLNFTLYSQKSLFEGKTTSGVKQP